LISIQNAEEPILILLHKRWQRYVNSCSTLTSSCP